MVEKVYGYTNLFFSTHGEIFDNLAGFIPKNFFDELYTQEDYPEDKVVGIFGVPDDYLFNYVSEKLQAIDSTKPFFATVLTTTNHDPYDVPSYFPTIQKSKDLKAVSYADWAIGKFLAKSANMS